MGQGVKGIGRYRTEAGLKGDKEGSSLGVGKGTGSGRGPNPQPYGWKYHRFESCLLVPVSGVDR